MLNEKILFSYAEWGGPIIVPFHSYMASSSESWLLALSLGHLQWCEQAMNSPSNHNCSFRPRYPSLRARARTTAWNFLVLQNQQKYSSDYRIRARWTIAGVCRTYSSIDPLTRPLDWLTFRHLVESVLIYVICGLARYLFLYVVSPSPCRNGCWGVVCEGCIW